MLGLVDALLLNGHRSGVEHSVLELVRALAELAPDEVGYACRAGLLAREKWLAARPTLAAPGWAAGRLGRIAAEQVWLPGAAARAGARVLHGPAYVLPLRWRGPSVVTVYDLVALAHPEWTKWSNALHYRLLLPRAVRRADAVVVPSQVVGDEVAERFGVKAERLHVVPLGVREIFRERPAPGEVEAFRRARRLDAPYFAVVGNLEPKKNLGAVVEAFGKVAGRVEQDLVIAGRPAWRYRRDLDAIAASPAASRIRLSGPLTEAELRACYAGATALLQWSLYEGFGLTPLEAMACGVPAVVSDGGALAETAGGGALVVPLADGVEGLAAALLRVASEDGLRRDLVRRGEQWQRRFTWRGHAESVLGLYRTLAG